MRYPRTGKNRPRPSPVALTVLDQIRSEHIAEMSYRDCFDGSIGIVGDQNGVFVVLKAGVEYVPGVASHVVSDTLSNR